MFLRSLTTIILAGMLASSISASPIVTDAGLTMYTGPELAELSRTQASNKKISRRQAKCEDNISIVVDSVSTFVDWDVQMSPVVCAQGSMMVAVAAGYTVTNSIGVSMNLMPTLVKDVLQMSVGIDYSRSWATTTTITTTGTVTNGSCGVMVTRPIVTRRMGRAFKGCLGKLQPAGTFEAKSYKEINLSGTKWVEGAISMCMKPGINPPLSRCSGLGNFV